MDRYRIPKPLSEIPIRLLPGAELLLKTVSEGRFASRDLYRLRLQAEHALLVSGFDELICLDLLKFVPFDYQVHAAQIMLRRFRGRGMLCDEVGLGKTIEAGLVLKEYLTRNVVQRVLIITPAALVEQWREELAVKFGLPDFITSADAEFRALGSAAWERFPRLIASIATARRAEHRAALAQIPYDLVIVDEAHHLKNRNSASWKFINDLQRKYILLLTATPVENDLDELYNLITLLKPGQLKTPREFRRQFVVQRRPAPAQKPRPTARAARRCNGAPHAQPGACQAAAAPGQYASPVPFARRSQLLPGRQRLCAPDILYLSPHEGGSDGDGCRDGEQDGLRQVDRFALLTLQREIGSSPQAAEPTLRALAARAKDPARREGLIALADQAAQHPPLGQSRGPRKTAAHHSATIPPKKSLIFTHFRRTLNRLAERLREMGLSLVVYHGEMDTSAKNQAIDDFEHHAQVLLSTEAAGEGRNLQFCRTMINFDIPWNPMRIEQRVGRIHRVGQTRDVRIYNLSARGTVEDYLLEILDQKLNMFELVIGEMDMILGELSDERDFEDLLLDIWVQSQNAESLQTGFNQLGEALLQARQTYQKTREYDDALFGEDFAAE